MRDEYGLHADHLGRILDLVHCSDRFYDKSVWEIKNSIVEAVKNGRYFLHWKDFQNSRECVGFCTWGFFTRQEVDEMFWHGGEVYAREKGEVLYFSNFLCLYGPSEVLKFIRKLQQVMAINYPEYTQAEGWRDYGRGEKRKAVMYI